MPSGNMAAASSSDMLGGTMTQSPGWEQTDVRKTQSGGCRGNLKPAGGGMYLPISRGGHSFSGCELERVHHSQDLVKVASGGGGIEQRQLQPLVGTDNKHLNPEQRWKEWITCPFGQDGNVFRKTKTGA